MLFAFLLTGSPQIFADLRTFWSKVAVEAAATGNTLLEKLARGILHLLNSGPAAIDGAACMTGADGRPTMKPWWQVSPEEFMACLSACTFHDADDGYFPGGGKSVRFKTRGGMASTMTRLLRDGDGRPIMHILHGETVDLAQAIHDVLDKRTNWTWPTTWFMPFGTSTMGPYEYMARWGANHCVLSAGHIGYLLRSLCALLGIRVGMTNLDEQGQFLPIQWLVNGDRTLATDWNVVNSLGPLYA
jgi:L-fucose isomerase